MVRRIALTTLLIVLLCSLQVPAQQPQDPLAAIAEKYPEGLPKYLTPEERNLPIPRPSLDDGVPRSPPTGAIYCPPEYAPCAGLFMSWEAYTSILTTMTVNITNNDPVAKVWMVVDTASEQTSAYNSLNAAGADMSQVEFLVRTTDSVWIRDYGPRFILEDGVRAIIDHTYNRPRPNDNLLNDYVASQWGIAQYDIPLTHGGGNFHLFANGDAFMTTLILNENPGYTEQQIKALYLQYQNVDLTIYTGFPTSFDSTQHIDMWFLPVGDNKVIVGQYASSTGQPYTITENAVADLTARGYTVYRTPGWQSGGTHYTYTNAVICNNLVFMSKFNVSQDATALAVFQSALPGKTIIQVNNSDIITAAGAMHCIVMHVPQANPNPSVTVNAPDGGETWRIGEQHDITWTATDDVGVTGVDLYYSVDGGATWPNLIAAGETNDGAYPWTIPNNISTQCRVKAVAHDGDGHVAEDISDADFSIAPPLPSLQLVHSFPMNSNPGWTAQSAWAFGTPLGGGTHDKDPTSGYAGGTYVYGYNLSGDYTNGLNPPKYLTTTAIDCSGLSNVELRFRRWLGVEGAADTASIEASHDNTNWTMIWQNGASTVSDSSWVLVSYDISAVADDHATVYIRWGMGPTDTSTRYPGWNIDEVEIWATQAACNLTADVNGDGYADGRDVYNFLACYIAGNPYAVGCGCSDVDESGVLDSTDIDLFVDALLD